MTLLDCVTLLNLKSKSENEKAILLCFYRYMEFGEESYSMSTITDMFVNCGFSAPNTSRLKEKLIKGKDKAFLVSKTKKNQLEFLPIYLQQLQREMSLFWNDSETIVTSSEVIDENKFCEKRQFIDRLIKQINCSYSNNCYDACAILMRRLFEVLLVLSYQHNNIDEEIKDSSGNGYIMLDGIVRNAQNNKILKLSRIKKEYDTFRMVGNFSAHNITYLAGKKDIDDIKLNYRVMLEELFNKAGLM